MLIYKNGVCAPNQQSVDLEFHAFGFPQIAAMDRSAMNDVEKNSVWDNLTYLETGKATYEETGAVPVSSFEYGDSVYAKLQRLAGRFNVEQRGIERVPEDERTDNSYFNIGSMVRCLSSFFLPVISPHACHSGWPQIWSFRRSQLESWAKRSSTSALWMVFS